MPIGNVGRIVNPAMVQLLQEIRHATPSKLDHDRNVRAPAAEDSRFARELVKVFDHTH